MKSCGSFVIVVGGLVEFVICGCDHGCRNSELALCLIPLPHKVC